MKNLNQYVLTLRPKLGTWVYQIIRGIDSSEVNSRTQIKSMLSAKSFRPSINTSEQASKWLRIFIADIYSRLVDEGVLENKRRPKTMNLHHRQGGQTRSRQAPIPQGKKLDESSLFVLAKTLLSQIIMEGRVWPCANLSLSVGGFEDGVVGNMGIGAFLLKGDEAKAMGSRDSKPAQISRDKPDKRRRLGSPSGIQKFLVKADNVDEHDDDFGAQDSPGLVDELTEDQYAGPGINDGAASIALFEGNEATTLDVRNDSSIGSPALKQQRITDYTCDRCNMALEPAEVQSHQDWHFAKDLQSQDRDSPARTAKPSDTAGSKKSKQSSNKKRSGHGNQEKGQTKLAFG
jgi:DNA polymerase eta